MDIPLTQYDVVKIINNLTDNYDFTIYLLDKNNKHDMCRMIRNHVNDVRSPITRHFFLIYYDLDLIGHWTTMIIDYDQMMACFYCSFGIFIDDQYNYKVEPTKEDELVKNILHKLFNMGFEVHYNNEQLQTLGTSVCGRYCGAYIAYNTVDRSEKLTNPDDFNDIIMEECEKSKLSPDDVIIQLTTI